MESFRDIHPQVVISVSEEEKEEEAPSADPQSYYYFCVLYLTALLALLVPLGLAPASKWNKPLFKPHHDILMVIVDALLSVATLSSIILVTAGFFLQRWMKNIHYTILKTIGCFSAIPTPFLLGLVIFVPHKLNMIVYSVICGILFVVILVAYYFAWKYACRYKQDTSFNDYPIRHLTAFLVILVPSMFVLPYYIPECAVNPFLVVCVVLFVINFGMFMIFVFRSIDNAFKDDDQPN